MEFGIALPTAAESWKLVQRAEALGFTHAWFYDTQMCVPTASWQWLRRR